MVEKNPQFVESIKLNIRKHKQIKKYKYEERQNVAWP